MPDLEEDDQAIGPIIPLFFALMNLMLEQQQWLQMEQDACRC